MKLYDYTNLSKTIAEAKKDKIDYEEHRERDRLSRLKNELVRLEDELAESGILEDWYNLQSVCEEHSVSLNVMDDWNGVEIRGPLSNFQKNGFFGISTLQNRSKVFYGFYVGRHGELWWSFSKWNTDGLPESCEMDEFRDDTKIEIVKNFLDTYEAYRFTQLSRISKKMKIGKEKWKS